MLWNKGLKTRIMKILWKLLTLKVALATLSLGLEEYVWENLDNLTAYFFFNCIEIIAVMVLWEAWKWVKK